MTFQGSENCLCPTAHFRLEKDVTKISFRLDILAFQRWNRFSYPFFSGLWWTRSGPCSSGSSRWWSVGSSSTDSMSLASSWWSAAWWSTTRSSSNRSLSPSTTGSLGSRSRRRPPSFRLPFFHRPVPPWSFKFYLTVFKEYWFLKMINFNWNLFRENKALQYFFLSLVLRQCIYVCTGLDTKGQYVRQLILIVHPYMFPWRNSFDLVRWRSTLESNQFCSIVVILDPII